jgi:CRISPR-associated endoribonuclease Cas6
MRIKVTFANKISPTFIPINTNYYIVSLIDYLCYEYQRYLKSLVPGNPPERSFNLYTFSQLIIPFRKIKKSEIGIISEEFYLYISSPFYQFLSIISKELVKRKAVKLFSYWFEVIDIDFFASPQFNSEEARFTCMSPVTVYKGDQINGENSYLQYMLPEEEDYNECLKKDILNKYNLVNRENRNHLNLKLQFDSEYIKRKNNKITKIITLESKTNFPAHVRGILAPLKIKAEPEILKLIYDAGLGRMNSFGFGMVETIHPLRVA